jgi:predicted TIM-barrel fold metal-dependent hydrolase
VNGAPPSGTVVCLEEHFWTPDLRHSLGPEASERAAVAERLDDLGPLRLGEMDAAGIDLQLISHSAPGVQLHDPESAVLLARRANDLLHRAIGEHPSRFAGFALLPTPDPQASVRELERAVTELGFKGAMIHGLTHGEFIDQKKYWPIFERAQQLDVPIYVHPAQPHPAVYDAYYKDYPIMARAGWGFGVEAGTQAIRLVLSGLFDAYPRLKIILGHLGEGLPYCLWRCDEILSRGRTGRRFREVFCEHFYITTSGNFSHPALLCCVMEMGVDHILFSIDWPYASNVEGRQFVETAPLSRADKDKILSHNAARLLRV